MGAALTSSIAVVLPPREGFSTQAFGAVSLSVRDFTRHSAMREHIHVYGGRHETPFEGIDYTACDVSRPWYLRGSYRYLAALKKHFTQNPPALIEVHNRPVLAKHIARWGIAPVSLFLHNDPRDMRATTTPRARAALEAQLAGVLHVSDYIQRCWQEHVPPRTSHHVCPLGIALPTQQRTKKNQILFVGRMVPEKGVHLLAESLTQCLGDFRDWQAVFVGGKRFAVEELSPYELHLQEMLKPIAAQIDWRGFQDHEATMQAFADAAIVVIPSLWEEPFGRIAVEAMAYGAAIITSGRGGLAEIVGDEAMIPEPFDAPSLTGALCMLMHNAAHRNQLQQRALARAAMFDISTAARHLDAVRNSLIAG